MNDTEWSIFIILNIKIAFFSKVFGVFQFAFPNCWSEDVILNVGFFSSHFLVGFLMTFNSLNQFLLAQIRSLKKFLKYCPYISLYIHHVLAYQMKTPLFLFHLWKQVWHFWTFSMLLFIVKCVSISLQTLKKKKLEIAEV